MRDGSRIYIQGSRKKHEKHGLTVFLCIGYLGTSPESMGMVAGLIYLVTLFLFIPFPFMKWFTAPVEGDPQELKLLTFPNLKVNPLQRTPVEFILQPGYTMLLTKGIFDTLGHSARRNSVRTTLDPVYGVPGLCG